MKKDPGSELTKQATRALTDAVAKAVEDHRRRGLPLAVWRNGKVVAVRPVKTVARQAARIRDRPPPDSTP